MRNQSFQSPKRELVLLVSSLLSTLLVLICILFSNNEMKLSGQVIYIILSIIIIGAIIYLLLSARKIGKIDKGDERTEKIIFKVKGFCFDLWISVFGLVIAAIAVLYTIYPSEVNNFFTIKIFCAGFAIIELLVVIIYMIFFKLEVGKDINNA